MTLLFNVLATPLLVILIDYTLGIVFGYEDHLSCALIKNTKYDDFLYEFGRILLFTLCSLALCQVLLGLWGLQTDILWVND